MKQNLRRALWLCLPVVVLAGALWFVKEHRPIEIVLESRSSELAQLRRLSQEATRHPWAPRVMVRSGLRDSLMSGSSCSFDRRGRTLSCEWHSFSADEWLYKNVSDGALHACAASPASVRFIVLRKHGAKKVM